MYLLVVVDENFYVKLVIVGDGFYFLDLKEFVYFLEFENLVIFIGMVEYS